MVAETKLLWLMGLPSFVVVATLILVKVIFEGASRRKFCRIVPKILSLAKWSCDYAKVRCEKGWALRSSKPFASGGEEQNS